MSHQFLILTKAEKFVLQLMQNTPNMPKYYRQTFAYRLDTLCVDLLEKLSEARYVVQKERQERLSEADIMIAKIRIILRLSYELKCISLGLLEELSIQLNEIGKMLGAMKGTEKNELKT